MKTCALLSLLFGSALAAYGQGTVNFANLANVGAVNAPVYESDGVTKCSGSQFMAELLAGPSADNLSSIATTGFLTGAGAGYFSAGLATINSVAPRATASVEVRVWNTVNGASFLQAQASGLPNSWCQWPVFAVVTGGGFQGPPPAPLIGLGTSPVYLNSIPEPSALALIGCGMVLVISRKGLTRQSTE